MQGAPAHQNSLTLVTATGATLWLSVLMKDTSRWARGAGDQTTDPLIEG